MPPPRSTNRNQAIDFPSSSTFCQSPTTVGSWAATGRAATAINAAIPAMQSVANSDFKWAMRHQASMFRPSAIAPQYGHFTDSGTSCPSEMELAAPDGLVPGANGAECATNLWHLPYSLAC